MNLEVPYRWKMLLLLLLLGILLFLTFLWQKPVLFLLTSSPPSFSLCLRFQGVCPFLSRHTPDMCRSQRTQPITRRKNSKERWAHKWQRMELADKDLKITNTNMPKDLIENECHEERNGRYNKEPNGTLWSWKIQYLKWNYFNFMIDSRSDMAK